MESGNVTTPFGRRAMSFGMLAGQLRGREIRSDQSVDKWKLFRSICEAKPLLGVTDRALAVLNALLSFYPKNELASRDGALVVFPSNTQLSLRAHGMAEQTIRRHLAALVEAGLLMRKDSPNGKRYARRNRAGEVYDAFGFSLAPLLARSHEIECLAAEVTAERLHVRQLRETLTLCRRDISKLADMAVEAGIPGNWIETKMQIGSILSTLPRVPATAQLSSVVEKLHQLRDELINLLESRAKTHQQGGTDNQSERHIQSSKPESQFESEPETSNTRRSELAASLPVDQPRRNDADRIFTTVGAPSHPQIRPTCPHPPYPLGLVLQACPQIIDYGPKGTVNSWRDLSTAAVVVRSMMNITSSAYEDACSAMGPENAAIVMACILERGSNINSAGGYLRVLIQRAEQGQFSAGRMVMALLRSNSRLLKEVG